MKCLAGLWFCVRGPNGLVPPRSSMKAPPPHPNPDSPHFLQFPLPWGYLVHSCCILVVAALSGSGSALGWVFLWLIPCSDTRRGFAQLFWESAGFYFNLHIAKPANTPRAGNAGNLEWPFFLVPVSPPEFPKTSQIKASGLIKFFGSICSRSLCVLTAHPSALSHLTFIFIFWLSFNKTISQ